MKWILGIYYIKYTNYQRWKISEGGTQLLYAMKLVPP